MLCNDQVDSCTFGSHFSSCFCHVIEIYMLSVIVYLYFWHGSSWESNYAIILTFFVFLSHWFGFGFCLPPLISNSCHYFILKVLQLKSVGEFYDLNEINEKKNEICNKSPWIPIENLFLLSSQCLVNPMLGWIF